jgi:hypothetical protein
VPLNAGYPALPFDGYRAQTLFHQIDTSFPGLQLVREKPYVFLVHEFLTSDECDQLIGKARAQPSLGQQLVGESEASTRTSVGCVARRDEVPGLRDRFARLSNVPTSHLQPLKISQYGTGARFAEHCDAVDGAGDVDEATDYYADRARALRGTRQCALPGANRFVVAWQRLAPAHIGPATHSGCSCARWFEPRVAHAARRSLST